MSDDYWHGGGAVYLCGYHLVWTTKYRRKLLFLEDMTIDGRLKELLKEKADEHGWEIRALETMADHVHMFVFAHQTNSPQYIANQFKGYTSRVLRDEFNILMRRAPSLWTRSYFCATVGNVSALAIEHYIANQRTSL